MFTFRVIRTPEKAQLANFRTVFDWMRQILVGVEKQYLTDQEKDLAVPEKRLGEMNGETRAKPLVPNKILSLFVSVL